MMLRAACGLGPARSSRPRRQRPSTGPVAALLPLLLLALAALATCGYAWSWRVGPPTRVSPGRGVVGAANKVARATTTVTTSSRWTQQRQRKGAGGLRCSGIQGWGRVEGRYSWTENEWELEVTVPVPAGTRKEEVLFKASPTTLQLALAPNTTGAPLLAGMLKGRITMDGTYWSLEGEGEERAIKLLLEKKPGALENAWDWRRVLAEEPATEADYQEPERFDPKEYSRAMLGPDGIDMSLVDKDMFASGGLFQNVTADTLQDYVEARVLDDASGLFPKKGKNGKGPSAPVGDGEAEGDDEEDGQESGGGGKSTK